MKEVDRRLHPAKYLPRRHPPLLERHFVRPIIKPSSTKFAAESSFRSPKNSGKVLDHASAKVRSSNGPVRCSISHKLLVSTLRATEDGVHEVEVEEEEATARTYS